MGRKSARFGQNFLTDPRYAERILDTLPSNDLPVLEVGPGRGILTARLLERGMEPERIWAVELDPQLTQSLESEWPRLRLHCGNILRTEIPALGIPTPFVLLSNLPYEISQPFFERLIEWQPLVSHATITVQKEFADKISQPSSRSALGHTLAWLYRIEARFNLPPGAFRPAPKVHSTVLTLTPNSSESSAKERKEYHAFLKLAFRMPRKTLRNNLAPLWPSDGEDPLSRLSLTAEVRPHELSSPLFRSLWQLLRTDR